MSASGVRYLVNLSKPGDLHIERKSLALDQLAVLRDRHVKQQRPSALIS
jgi:hypothetical protein